MYGRRTSSAFSSSTTRMIYTRWSKYTLVLSSLQSKVSRSTYVDRPETGTVTGSHVLIERVDGISSGQLSEFLVHVVGS